VIFSAVNITSAVGKLFFGYISDRFKVEYCAMMGFLLGLVGTVVLITVDPSSSIVLVGVYVLAMGLAVGCWAPLTSMIVGTIFGMEHYATIFGTFSLFFYMGTGTSPTFFGIVYDATHQYFLAYVSALVFYSMATVLMLVLLRLKRRSASVKAATKE
jgi:MFS family permease